LKRRRTFKRDARVEIPKTRHATDRWFDNDNDNDNDKSYVQQLYNSSSNRTLSVSIFHTAKWSLTSSGGLEMLNPFGDWKGYAPFLIASSRPRHLSAFEFFAKRFQISSGFLRLSAPLRPSTGPVVMMQLLHDDSP
jgi:hypothetical protein